MRFPQWAFSHRPCARSGRTRSRSSWWRRTGPIGLGSQNWCSSRQPLLGKFLWGGISFPREGAPSGTRVQTCTYGPWRDAEVLGGLPPSVVNTITSARAPSTRHAYRLKWNLFVDWCSSRREDPRRCPIAVVLSFLQDGLERRLSPSTLKVYVAAIAAHHDAVNGKSVGKHDLVVRFLRGARRLNPPRPHLVPSWDLPSVLTALKEEPFEPLQSVELKVLSLKTVLLTALALVKRVGDLQAFSVDDSCLEFGPAEMLSWDPGLDMCPKFPPRPLGIRWWTCKRCPGRRQTQPLLCSVPSAPCAFTWTARRASGPQTSSLSASEDSRRERLSPNRDLPTG